MKQNKQSKRVNAFKNIGADECSHCGLCRTKEGHDGCLGTIPDAVNACCGHGEPFDAYIQYSLYDVPRLARYDIRGQEALDIVRRRRMEHTGKNEAFFDLERHETWFRKTLQIARRKATLLRIIYYRIKK